MDYNFSVPVFKFFSLALKTMGQKEDIEEIEEAVLLSSRAPEKLQNLQGSWIK